MNVHTIAAGGMPDTHWSHGRGGRGSGWVDEHASASDASTMYLSGNLGDSHARATRCPPVWWLAMILSLDPRGGLVEMLRWRQVCVDTARGDALAGSAPQR